MVNRADLDQVATWLKEADSIDVFCGAGLSAESGVPTYRGKGGAYDDPEVVTYTQRATLYTERAPQQLAWYQARREQMATVAPNPGHRALGVIAAHKPMRIATQNVDDLIQRAAQHAVPRGPRATVWHLHGTIADVTCRSCGAVIGGVELDLTAAPPCPACGGQPRPGVVLFGEALPEDVYDAAAAAAKRASVYVVVGTSGVVVPAAFLPVMAAEAGARIVEINPEKTELTFLADVCLRGPSGEVLPALLEAMGLSM